MDNKLNLQQFPNRLKSLTTPQIANTGNQLKGDKLVVLHADLDCHQDAEFFFCDEVQVLGLEGWVLRGLGALEKGFFICYLY